MKKSMISALALVPMFSGQAAASCYIQNYKWFWGSNTSTVMNVSSAASCGSSMHHHGTMMNSITIVKPASSGTAYSEGLNWWGYKSKPGFKGTDHFVVRLSSDKGDSDVDVTVNVN